MKRYWTADLHFNHGAICIYCKRPWLRPGDVLPTKKVHTSEDGVETLRDTFVSKEVGLFCAERMNKGIKKNINGRVKPEDTVCHVGDLMTMGAAKGIEGLKIKPVDILSELNGNWVIIEGNHDRNNSVKPVARYMFTKIGQYNAFVSHYPIENISRFNPKLVEYVINNTDFQICGHVHNAWKYKFTLYKGKKYLMYNVGIDVHRYYPVNDMEVIADVDKIKRENRK